MTNEKEIKEKLTGRNIIMVEDDESLHKRLTRELSRYDVATVTVKHTVDSGLTELKEHGTNYDLAIVDVMLPKSESDYYKIKALRDELSNIQTMLTENDETSIRDKKPEKEIAHAQEKRRHIIAEIELFICKDGGIQMVKQWVEGVGSKNICPILYFTALGDDELKTEGLEVAGNSNAEWLTKPVTVNNILSTAGVLIAVNSMG